MTTTSEPSRTRPSPLVAEAAHCDARGEYESALRLLTEASKHGDPEAMTRLGKRLLIASNAPNRPQEGTALVIEATRLGGAEAAAQLAVLAAIGMFVPQSWETSLTAIAFAAERGWPAARGQLRLLSADRELATRAADAATVDSTAWRQLASTIDLDRWHLPAPHGVTAHGSPLIRRFPISSTTGSANG